MANVYKIQNRTENSHRVLFQKNGGTVSFPNGATTSFVENNYEAGFCLTPLAALPVREGVRDVELPAHPIGVDGRVSIYVDGVLTETKRYDSLQGFDAKVAWFNTEFGGVVNYAAVSAGAVKLTTVNNEVNVIVVFEDDDIDYIFNNFTATNPVVVEQYRLAVYLYKDIQISCEGAPNSTGCIDFDDNGRYTIYLNLSDTPTLIDATPQEILDYFNENNPTDLLVTRCDTEPTISCEGATSSVKLLGDSDAITYGQITSITVNDVEYPMIADTYDSIEERFGLPENTLSMDFQRNQYTGADGESYRQYNIIFTNLTGSNLRVQLNGYRPAAEYAEASFDTATGNTNPTVMYCDATGNQYTALGQQDRITTALFCLSPAVVCIPVDLPAFPTPEWYDELLSTTNNTFSISVRVSRDTGAVYSRSVTWMATDDITNLNYWISEAIKAAIGDNAIYPVFTDSNGGLGYGRIASDFSIYGSNGDANDMVMNSNDILVFTVEIYPNDLPDIRYDIGAMLLDNNVLEGVIYSSCGVTDYEAR